MEHRCKKLGRFILLLMNFRTCDVTIFSPYIFSSFFSFSFSGRIEPLAVSSSILGCVCQSVQSGCLWHGLKVEQDRLKPISMIKFYSRRTLWRPNKVEYCNIKSPTLSVPTPKAPSVQWKLLNSFNNIDLYFYVYVFIKILSEKHCF